MKATFYKSDLRHLGVNKYASQTILEQNLEKIVEIDNPNFNMPTYSTGFFIIDTKLVPAYNEINYIKLELPSKTLYFYVETFDYRENSLYTEFNCNLDYFHTFILDFYNQPTIDKTILLEFVQATVRKDIYLKTKYLWDNPYLKHIPSDLEIETIKKVWENNPSKPGTLGFRPFTYNPVGGAIELGHYVYVGGYGQTGQASSDWYRVDKKGPNFLKMYGIIYAQKDIWIGETLHKIAFVPLLTPLALERTIFETTNLRTGTTGQFELATWTDFTKTIAATEQVGILYFPISPEYIHFDMVEQNNIKFLTYINTEKTIDYPAYGYTLASFNDLNLNIYNNIWYPKLAYINYGLFYDNPNQFAPTIDFIEKDLFFDHTKYHSSLIMYNKLHYYFSNIPWTIPACSIIQTQTEGDFTSFDLNIWYQGTNVAITVKPKTTNPLFANINEFNIYFSPIDATFPSTSDAFTNYRNQSATTSTTGIALSGLTLGKATAFGAGAGLFLGGGVGALLGTMVGGLATGSQFMHNMFERSDIKRRELPLNGSNIFGKLLDWDNLHCEIEILADPDLEKANYYFNYFGNIVSQPLTLSEWIIDKSTEQVNYLKINNIEQAFSFLTTNEVKEYFKNLFANGVRIWEKKIKII